MYVSSLYSLVSYIKQSIKLERKSREKSPRQLKHVDVFCYTLTNWPFTKKWTYLCEI